jgi:PAS domain S-box-containing protein
MQNMVSWFSNSSGFMPHGMCYLWQPGVLWLNVASDGLIATAYYAIPLSLLYLVRERRSEITFPGIVLMFAAFILLCGTTHLMEIWTVWHPDYRVAGVLKALTGIVSVATTLALFRLIPQAMLLQSPRQLQREVEARTAELVTLNEELRAQMLARDRAEGQLREQARLTEELGRTWAVSPDLLAVLDDEGLFESTNPAWASSLGWSEDDLRATNFWERVHPEDLSRTQDAWNELRQGTSVVRLENRYRCKNGDSRWLSWVVVPSKGQFYCSARDISAMKEAQSALARSEDALRQSQKMEAVGQLTGGLAHDFNNLLAGMMGSLEMTRTKMAQGRFTDIERYLEVAQGAGRRAAALTQRLLAFSRRQTLDPKVTDTNQLIAEMADLIRRTMGPAIKLEVVGAAGLWATLVDPSQLENAVLNLCLNARDAMPDGGSLTIETANKWLDERAAAERELPTGQYISVCVTDTGVGMTPAVIARAFDPFFTTKPIGQGTGLGLSMIFGFAKQSGGQVRIYSEVGRGTTVCIYLPRNHESSGTADNDQAQATVVEAVRGEGEVVLVIDDEPSIRMLISEVLHEAGYTAIEVGDGPAGLRILQSNAKIDLLITDVGLPGGMNGRQVADAARVLRPRLKVLFITGYAENAVISHKHLEVGMHLLTKPFPMETLGRRIREILGD